MDNAMLFPVLLTNQRYINAMPFTKKAPKMPYIVTFLTVSYTHRLAGEYAASTAAAMTNSTMTASDPIGRLQDA